MTSCKLRIATVNHPRMVDVVLTQVLQATGLSAQPVLQEIDRRELIVELVFNSVGSCSARDLAQRIQSSAPNLEVLGSWHVLEASPSYGPPRSRTILFSDDESVPPLARRAFDDQVPTAGWQPTAGSDNSHWLLAVPLAGSDGRMVAALARREGHYHRFTAQDAVRLRGTLAA